MSNAATRTIVGRRTKYLVVVLWLLFVALLGPLASKLSGAEKNDAQAWLPGKAESTREISLQAAFQSPNTYDAVAVYRRGGGLTVPDRSKIASDARKFATVGVVDGAITGPLFSKDQSSALVVVPLDLGVNGWNQSENIVGRMKAIMRGDRGLEFHVTGPAGYAADSAGAFKGIDGTLLYAAMAVVIVILLITYRSPILWILPVLSTGISLMVAEGLIYLLARHGLVVNAMSAGILTVLVFGAGTDYALLLVARYREELRRHEDRHEAMARALHRAGPALVASAGTVVLGMMCLLVAETNSTAGLGPVAAIGVIVALLAMVTLLPALLVVCGRWVFWPSWPRFGSNDPAASGFWARTGERIGRHPRRVWVLTAAVLGALAVAVTGLHANGLTNKQAFRGHPDSIAGEAVLTREFPAGAGSPVVVVARAPAASQVRADLAATPGIGEIVGPVVKGGEAYLQGTPYYRPDSSAAFATVERVRTALHRIPGADALVGGDSAVNLDERQAARHDRALIIPVVLLVVLAVLGLLLRSLIAPVVLVATVLLSFGSALGISALAFNHLFGFGGADASFPLYAFVFLVALGIDYNIFLMTRVREEAAHHGTRAGALTGLAATGGVITSAGFVLAGTFAVLSTLPVTSFAEIGFTVALGVLLDTLVVRSILVTALNLDIGRWMWWPSRLAVQGRHDSDGSPVQEARGMSASPVGSAVEG